MQINSCIWSETLDLRLLIINNHWQIFDKTVKESVLEVNIKENKGSYCLNSYYITFYFLYFYFLQGKTLYKYSVNL